MSPPPLSPSQQTELYQIYRDYVKHEDDLINNRLSWNFTIQGFLFAAYSLSLQKVADIRLGLSQTAIDGKRIAQLKVLHVLFDLQLLSAALALAGIGISFFVYLSVSAARIAVKEVEGRWNEINPAFKATSDFRPFKWVLNDWIRGRNTAAKTHGPNPPGLPGLIGGGHPAAHWMGFHAPGGLPLTLVAVWVFLLVDGLLDLR